MKISGGKKDKGVVIGNAYDKYGTKNIIAKYLFNKFERGISSFIEKIEPKSIHDVGCGEGYWTIKLSKQGINTTGSDFSREIISIAKDNAVSMHLKQDIFCEESIYSLTCDDSAELLLCIEVLEHLKDPLLALNSLKNIAEKYLIISVPREPMWSFMNLLRGKYIKNLANTPGHIQLWSKKQFISLISKFFDVIEVKNPIPWTIILCKIGKNENI